MNKITPARAKELNQNFVKTRGRAIDRAIGKNDAISAWFSIDDLKEYIAFVEKEGKQKGITVNGLRVYFGAYANTDIDIPKKNMSTVFFIPTHANLGSGNGGDGDNSDITEIDGMNDGAMGQPPFAEYPQ